MNYNEAELCKDCKMPVVKSLRRLISQLGDELYQVGAKDNESARHLDKARRILNQIERMDLG